MRRAVAALAILLAFAPARPASASEEDDATATAKRLFKAGTQDYLQGHYKSAISEFEAAYRTKPHPSLFYNLAKTYEKLGQLPSALLDYYRYIHDLPEAPDRGQVEAAIARIESQLAERGRQGVLITTEPSGATVTVDGAERGHTPFAGELAHGAHTLAISLRGFQPARKEVLAQPGGTLQLTFSLDRTVQEPEQKPAETTASSTAAANHPGSSASPTTVPEGALQADAGSASSPEAKRTWTWVGVGVTGAALVAAGTLAVLAQQDRLALRSGTVHPTAEAQALYDGADGKHRASNVLFGVAGGAAAATVAVFFVEGRF